MLSHRSGMPAWRPSSTHLSGVDSPRGLAISGTATITGLSLTLCGMGTCNVAGDPEQVIAMVDMWEQDGTTSNPLGHPANTLNNSQTCSQDRQQGCQFEDDVFHSQVVKVVANAAKSPSIPLFLYWAAHACHGPREVPQSTYDKFSFIPNPQRRM